MSATDQWPFTGDFQRFGTKDAPDLRRALAYIAIGEGSVDQLELLIERDVREQIKPNGVGQRALLTRAVYGYWLDRADREGLPVEVLLRRQLGALGLDRLIRAWGLESDAVDYLLAERTHFTREGMILRFLLWSATTAGTEPQFGLLSGYFPGALGLGGRFLAGDGILPFRESGSRHQDSEASGRDARIVVHDAPHHWTSPFPEREWEDNGQVRTFHFVARGLGWMRFLSLRLDENRPIWNGRLARLRDVSLEDVDSRPTMRLELESTDYVAAHATNFGFRFWPADFGRVDAEGTSWLADEIERQRARWAKASLVPGEERGEYFEKDLVEIDELLPILRAAWIRGSGFSDVSQTILKREEGLLSGGMIRGSQFANPLSVNIAYETDDGQMMIQERNKANAGHGHVDWQTSAAGFIARPRDVPIAGMISIWDAARHETQEELGAEVEAGSLLMLGLVRESRAFEVGLLGTGQLTQSVEGASRAAAPVDKAGRRLRLRSDILGRSEIPHWDPATPGRRVAGPGFDQSADVKDFVAIPFTPDALASFVANQGGWQSWMPLGGFAAVAALGHRLGGWPGVEAAWNRSGPRIQSIAKAGGRPDAKLRRRAPQTSVTQSPSSGRRPPKA